MFVRVEKQRAALQEKLQTQQAQQNATQIKQQMEEQLKQQRAAMQQKRLLEAQGKTIVTTANSLLTTGMYTTPIKCKMVVTMYLTNRKYIKGWLVFNSFSKIDYVK